jgi:hypothetical protein
VALNNPQELTGAELGPDVDDDAGGFAGDFNQIGQAGQEVYGPGNWGGVYSEWPAAMPKHHPGTHLNSTRTSQARMWLPFADLDAFEAYKKRLSQRAQDYVKALSTFIDGARGIGYVDFFLQSVNESYQEKVQVSEVLSDGYIAHFFGQRAPMWGYSGVVLNTDQDEWYDIWHILYEDVLRGTRLSEARLPVRLAYDTRVVSGSIVNMSTTLNAPNETFATLQFQILVKDVKYSPSSVAKTSELIATGLGSTQFGSADELVTSVYSGLSAARRDFRDEAKVVEDVRPGSSPQELREQAGVNVTPAIEVSTQNQSLLEDPANMSSIDNPPPTEGTGVDTAPAPAFQQPLSG